MTMRSSKPFKRGIELGFLDGEPLVYDGTEPVAIDAQAGKGKLARFLGVNLVSPRTTHVSKIITDPKDAELTWVAWKTLERQGYDVRFINPGRLHGYRSETFNLNTRLLEVANVPELRPIVGDVAYDAASFLLPIDPAPNHRWIGQGARVFAALYNKQAACFPSTRWPCTAGGLWDFFARDRQEIADDLMLWASEDRRQDDAGMCHLVASFLTSNDQWNAYASLLTEQLRGFSKGSAARMVTDANSFDPADMKKKRTALFIIGSSDSDTSHTLIGAMTAAIVERFAGSHGPLRALVIGEEWGQLYLSNFYKMLTLYRQGGVDFLGVFQNAPAQIDRRYGEEVARTWRKAVAHTLYRGLPDDKTLEGIERRSGRTSVMVRGFNVSNAQVNGSGDNLVEQARPLLQVEDVRRLTGGETALLESRDHGFFVVDLPNFWERTEMSGMLRDVTRKPDRYAWLADRARALPAPAPSQDRDAEIRDILNRLKSDADL